MALTMTENEAGGLTPWLIHGERIVYDNEWVRLALVDVEPPGVERFEHHVVRLRRAAVAVVLDEQDRVLMLRRYRFVSAAWGWELPGGLVEEAEDPATAVAREVEEETGWMPAQLTHAVTYEPMIGMVASPHSVFVGVGATFRGDPQDVEEAGEVKWVPLSRVPKLLAGGELAGSGTIIGLLHVLALGKPAPTIEFG